ncbi:MAG: glutamate racemase [Clostridia bacterium]|nr:glutamate racemase [Clostridia bacterium]
MAKASSAPVGIFDSGVGGISVLKCARLLLPHEHFIYYGDTLHAPYGTKPPHEVLGYARHVVDLLLARGVKAIVIACNTATSVAAAQLRSQLDLPIIGMEPALKPASQLRHGGRVLVLATPVTLSLPKFQHLMELYGQGCVPVQCPGLMDLVEQGCLSGPEVEALLRQLLAPYQQEAIDAVVLGCTHYVFLRKAVEKMFPGAWVLDGNEGTVRQLKRRLEGERLLAGAEHTGGVELLTSGASDTVLPLMERLLDS